MSAPFVPPDPNVVARVRAMAEESLSPEEFTARLQVPLSDEEYEETRSLIEWFTRRYKTPVERLRYARHAYRRWQRGAPASAAPPVK
jgi:hypothetical protein